MKCTFEIDRWGFYFTPVIGYSNTPSLGRMFWIGWWRWLWVFNLGEYSEKKP